jgi:polar amino acid transport system substrate-binding protein
LARPNPSFHGARAAPRQPGFFDVFWQRFLCPEIEKTVRVHFMSVLFLMLMGVANAGAQIIELRVAYEDKDSADHTGSSLVIPAEPGIMGEMVLLLETRIPNVRIVFSRKPWARCLADLENGTVDAIFSSSFKPDRLKIGVYPMKDGKDDRRYRIDTKSYSLYTVSESAGKWDGKRFQNVQQGILALRGYSVVDDLTKLGVPVKEVNRAEDGFRMLLAGRADGFAHLSEFGDYVLKKNPEFASIVKVDPPIVTKDYYLQISHQFNARYPVLVPMIWTALAEIRQAEFKRLEAKYLKRYAD